MKQSILENIIKHRKRAGLSQSYVASKLNITQTAYSKIELGKTHLSDFYLLKLPEILGVHLQDLVGDDYSKYSPPILPLKSKGEESQAKTLRQYIESLNSIIQDKNKLIQTLESNIEANVKIITLLEDKIRHLENK